MGKLIVINADFDMSGNTDLQMVFIKPDCTEVVKDLTDGVVAPAVPITVDVNGVETTFAANEYWQYPTEAGLIDVTGEWEVYGVYIDATPKNFAGNPSKFTVLPRKSC